MMLLRSRVASSSSSSSSSSSNSRPGQGTSRRAAGGGVMAVRPRVTGTCTPHAHDTHSCGSVGSGTWQQRRRVVAVAKASSTPGGPAGTTGSAAAGPSVVVIGGGVAGLTSALRVLTEVPGSTVTIVSDKLGIETTTAGAAGLWGPYKMSNTPEELVNRWGGETFEHLMGLFYSRDAVRAGVFLCYAHHVTSGYEDPPAWHNVVHNWAPMDPKHLALLPGKYTHGHSYGNVMCEGRFYMQYVTDAINATGRAEWRNGVTLSHWKEALTLGSFNALVNCSGLGAHTVAGDKEMYPIRGQVMRVRAPWVTQVYRADTDFYIIPNREYVVLGGTAQVGDWSTEVDASDQKRIWEGCCALVPSLAQGEVVEDWVGLRPGRPSVRVEIEAADVPVVHNYGHGGAGLTLSWGCAGDVARLLRGALG
ncbi:hypothetical protein FOA52_004376 [Chlamydomonas sp. UWO 241]|nr:hypothetical protein FOA52_004376 [Chlamydomonas sp. UWO 241]